MATTTTTTKRRKQEMSKNNFVKVSDLKFDALGNPITPEFFETTVLPNKTDKQIKREKAGKELQRIKAGKQDKAYYPPKAQFYPDMKKGEIV